MGLIDKFKNLFTEEVEVEVEETPKKEPIQKEMIQVEIPSPKKSRLEMHSEEIDIKPQIKEEPKTQEHHFPFFDDNDFDEIDIKPEPKERKKENKRKEVYNPPREEKKTFRPSPIISPVYGILDKGYSKDEYTNKQEGRSSYYSAKEANVDAIRNKAYGGLEADIETTLFGGNRVLFDEKEEKEVKEEKKEDYTFNSKVLEEKQEDYTFDSKVLEEKPRHGNYEEDDLTDLLEEEMEKPVEEKKEPRKISDKELFNLIDSMYEKGNK